MNMCYCTIDDIYNLPEGQRAELIDGELYMMATPGRIHQRLVMELSFRISDYTGLKSRKPLVC
ncbi:MAG: Uma2 family endonuclease [Lachnospiraceae bacterium]|nr:Uma2 family endonuclease [Lachnospiraceae bacterium]